MHNKGANMDSRKYLVNNKITKYFIIFMNDYFNKYIANQKRRVENDEQNEQYKEKYIKEITWNYNGLSFLKSGDPPPQPPRNETQIYLCLYRINTKSKPFLEFGFEYYNKNMNFCSIVLGKNEDFSEKYKEFLDTNFEYENKDNENKIYKGYVLFKGSTYIFIDTSFYKTRKTSEKKGIEYFLVDEIINHSNFLDVNDFFLKNNHFLYLVNEKGEKIETPSIAYIGAEEYKLHFLYAMGPMRFTYNSIYFPFYCFSNKNGSMVSNENEKRGAIKFALFLGNMKITNNYEKLDDKFYETINEIFEKKFDSLYISKNNNYLPNFPLWIVKNKEQFIPLSIVYQD
jgi:hypothetical protein